CRCRGMNVVQQNDAPVTVIKACGYRANDALCIAGAPIEGVDVDSELRDVSTLQVSDAGLRVGQIGIAEEGRNWVSGSRFGGSERRFDLRFHFFIGEPSQIGM